MAMIFSPLRRQQYGSTGPSGPGVPGYTSYGMNQPLPDRPSAADMVAAAQQEVNRPRLDSTFALGGNSMSRLVQLAQQQRSQGQQSSYSMPTVGYLSGGAPTYGSGGLPMVPISMGAEQQMSLDTGAGAGGFQRGQDGRLYANPSMVSGRFTVAEPGPNVPFVGRERPSPLTVSIRGGRVQVNPSGPTQNLSQEQIAANRERTNEYRRSQSEARVNGIRGRLGLSPLRSYAGGGGVSGGGGAASQANALPASQRSLYDSSPVSNVPFVGPQLPSQQASADRDLRQSGVKPLPFVGMGEAATKSFLDIENVLSKAKSEQEIFDGLSEAGKSPADLYGTYVDLVKQHRMSKTNPSWRMIDGDLDQRFNEEYLRRERILESLFGLLPQGAREQFNKDYNFNVEVKSPLGFSL